MIQSLLRADQAGSLPQFRIQLWCCISCVLTGMCYIVQFFILSEERTPETSYFIMAVRNSTVPSGVLCHTESSPLISTKNSQNFFNIVLRCSLSLDRNKANLTQRFVMLSLAKLLLSFGSERNKQQEKDKIRVIRIPI